MFSDKTCSDVIITEEQFKFCEKLNLQNALIDGFLHFLKSNHTYYLPATEKNKKK